jgi:predicted RNA-binding Zn ribbon-like protein
MDDETGRSGFHPAQRAVDLAEAVRRDPAVSRDELAAILRSHGETAADVDADAFGDEDAAELVTAIERLTVVLRTPDVDAAAERLNELLAECAARPRLTRHGGHPWHLHVDRADDTAWGEWFITSSALALAQLLSERGRLAWGECASPGCAALFLDSGPGSPRRFCSTTCATRTRVAAHRARRSGS